MEGMIPMTNPDLPNGKTLGGRNLSEHPITKDSLSYLMDSSKWVKQLMR